MVAGAYRRPYYRAMTTYHEDPAGPWPAVQQAQPVPYKPPEPPLEMYARQTRNAVTVIAWIVGIAAVLTVIGGIILGVQLAHYQNELVNGSVPSTSNCLSQGGINTAC
jgi:hypothetical protein